MPTYAYRCTECGTAFDVHQEFSDNSLTECPNCGGKLRKVFGTVGVTFNGSGFYRNDSRAKSGGEKGSGGDASSGSSGSSDSSGGSGSTSSDSGSSSSAPAPSSKPAAAPSSTPSSSPSGS